MVVWKQMGAYLALNHLQKFFSAGSQTRASKSVIRFSMDILLKNAFFATFFFAHRAPERPQSNLYLKTFMFCKYKGFQEGKNAKKCLVFNRFLESGALFAWTFCFSFATS